MMDNRRFERRPYNKTTDFSVSVLEVKELKRLNLNGTSIDINDTGMGIRVDYPLEPGHVLRFDSNGQKTGVVKWSMKSGDTYRVGLNFV